MKNKKIHFHRAFQKTLALVLSVVSVASLTTEAVPALLEELRPASMSDITLSNETYADSAEERVIELSQETKDRIKNIQMDVDYAPNHYVGSKRYNRKTVWFPEKDEPKGFYVNGSTSNDDWYYRSLRSLYPNENDTINPMMPYIESEDRADHYWKGGSFKYYYNNYESADGHTRYLPDIDAWFDCTDQQNGTCIIKNKFTTQGFEFPNDKKHEKYYMGYLTLPIKVTFKIPANTTYRITLNFKMNVQVNSGEYSIAFINGKCNEGLTSTDQTPGGSIIHDASAGIKYDHLESFYGSIVAYDHVPSLMEGNVSNEAYKSENWQTHKYYDLILTNKENTEQTFTRCYYVLATHAPDSYHKRDDDQLDSGFNGKVSIEIADLHYAGAMTELSADDFDSGESLQVEIGSQGNKANGATWNYGLNAEYGTYTYLGAYGESETASLADAFGATGKGSVTLSDDNTIRISYPAQNGVRSVNYMMACVPVRVSYKVPANTKINVTDIFNITPNEEMNGEFIVGVLDGEVNKSLSEKDQNCLSIASSNNIYYTNSQTISMIGSSNTGNICFTSRILGKEYTSGGEEVTKALVEQYRKNNLTDNAKKKLVEDAQRASIEKGGGTKGTMTGSKTFTFDNQSGSAQVFERYFVIYVVRQFLSAKSSEQVSELGNVDVSINITAKVETMSAFKKEDAITTKWLSWNKISANDINKINEASDKDIFTNVGWYRMFMDQSSFTAGETVINSVGGNVIAGTVSNSGFTAAQQYFTHPLGNYLKYAWLYNGVDSQPGAQGYDYARPEGRLKITYLTGNKTSTGTRIADNVKTMETYQSFYVKYAGTVNGKDTYYVALEGTDGNRMLMCRTASVVGSDSLKDTVVFVSAGEYEACPELYQTAYGWPTSVAAAQNLSPSYVGAHRYKGFWQANASNMNNGDTVVSGELTDEAFRVKVNGALQWSIVIENGRFAGFSNSMTAEAISAETSSLYAYYQEYKDKTGTDDKKLLDKYSSSIGNCLNKLKSIPTAYLGVSGVTITTSTNAKTVDYTNAEFKLTTLADIKKSISDGFVGLSMILGTYDATYSPGEGNIEVKSGETLEITSDQYIGVGKTLTVDKGATLRIKGTLVNRGTLLVFGTVIIEDYGCLRDETKDAATIGKGTYNFYGGHLIISEFGMFRQRYEGEPYSVLSFNANSTIDNDGLFIAPRGLSLNASTFNNGTNGVLMLGASIQASSDIYDTKTLTTGFVRGTPNTQTCRKLVYNSTGNYMTLIIYGEKNKELHGDDNTNENGIFMKDHSVLRNNGVLYDFGGIYMYSTTGNGNNVLVGLNSPIHYANIIKVEGDGGFDHSNNARTALTIIFNSDAHWWGNGTSENLWKDMSDSDHFEYGVASDATNKESNYVKFGTQWVQDALAGSAMSTADWNKNYNVKIETTDPGGGC